MKSVLIAGTSRRLGLFLTQHFLLDRWQVSAITRSANDELKLLQKQYPQSLRLVCVEDYNQDAAVKIASHLSTHFPSILINNVSIYEEDKPFATDGCEQFLKLFQIHMAFPALLSDAYYRLACEHNQKGLVINMTDIYAENPTPEHSFYCATKAGLENLSRSCAKKYAKRLRVNSIQPGPLKFLPRHNESDREKVLALTLLHREGGFEPVYRTVLFLFNNDFITGTAIKVDGGQSINHW